MHTRFVVITICFLLAGISAKAQSSGLAMPKLDSPPLQGISTLSELEQKEDALKGKSKVYGQIRLEGMQYATSIPESPRLTYSQLLSAQLAASRETTWADFSGDVSGGTFFSRGQSHFVVRELYASSKGQDFKVSAGRKKQEWSELDNRWQLGLWQPYFSIDALRPESQGLSGFFFDYNRENIQVLAFATPIYIPSMGPDIREEGGGLVSDSRWYRAPSRDYDFNDRINKITYNLDIPDAMKLVNNPGGALMTRLGKKETGPWMVLSAGYLPVNELILKRQNYKQISTDQVDVTVAPTVAYHTLASVDVGYTVGRLKNSVSYIEDRPQEKRPDGNEQDWAIQKLQPIQAYSVASEFTLENLWARDFLFQISYLKVEGGGITDILADGSPDSFTLFDQRLKFTNTAAFRVEGQLLSIRQRPLVGRMKYLYDYDQRGSLLNTEFLYYPNQQWAFLVGTDVLGVQDENYRPSSFLNQFRANDRFYGGMTYVF